MFTQAKLERRMQRYREFFEHPEPGQILITIPPYTYSLKQQCERIIHRPLSGWDPFTEAELMAENAVAGERFYMEHTEEIGCDYIPCVSPGYGIALCSAYFSGSEVTPGVDTSWIHPVVDTWDQLDALTYREDDRWVDFMRRYQRRALDLCEGDYCVAMLGAFAPSDMANALRGNALFTDLYDEPERVRRLLEVSAGAILSLYRSLRGYRYAPEGYFVAGGLALPGDGFFMSEDAADLCSPAAYREFFGPYTQRILDTVGSAYIHHHAKGWKVQGEIAKLRNLRFLEFSWDPNCPRPVDHLEEVMAMTGETPLQIRLTARDVYQNIDVIRRGRIALMVNVDTQDEAKDVVAFVRKHSKI